MSWASSINTENCFERYAFDQSFAPSLRRTSASSSSSARVPSRVNLANVPSRARSASPAPKRSFFRASKRERSNPTPQPCASISAPVLISSTNPLAIVASKVSTISGRLEEHKSQKSTRICEILADYKNEEEEEEDYDEEIEHNEEEIHVTSLSPTPPIVNNKPSSRTPSPSNRQSSVYLKSQTPIFHTEPGSHFSAWSLSTASLSSKDELSRPCSPTDSTFSRRESTFSRRESVASIYSDCTSITSSDSESFQYNPYISTVATRGFQQSDEVTLRRLDSNTLRNYQMRICALEEEMAAI